MSNPGVTELTRELGRLKKEGGIACITGMTGGASALACARLSEENRGQLLIIVSSRERAKQMEEFLAFFAAGKKIYVLPDEERSLFPYEAKSRVLSYRRLECLTAALSGEDCIFIAPVMAAVKGMPGVERFREVCVRLRPGDTVDYERVRRMLLFTGYERAEVTEVKGQFSMRGGIIDVFPPDREYPYRIDLFDDEVDDLKIFDPMSQRSIRSVKEICISPAAVPNPAEDSQPAFLWDYMAEGKFLFADDWDRICEQRDLADRDWAAGALGQAEAGEGRPESAEFSGTGRSGSGEPENAARSEHGGAVNPEFSGAGRSGTAEHRDVGPGTAEYGDVERGTAEYEDAEYAERMKRRPEYFADMYELAGALRRFGGAVTMPFRKTPLFVGQSELSASVNVASAPEFGGRMDHYAEELRRLIREGYRITVSCVSQERVKNLSEFAERTEIEGAEQIQYVEGFLPQGVILPETREAFLSDNDIFKAVKRKKKKKRKQSADLNLFADLKNGDYVVHENHGIGRFVGIEPLKVEGNRKDYLKIKYAGNDLLYVPVEQMDLVQKYIGSGGAAPKLNKLAGGDWKKTKARAKAAIENMAEELVRLSAERTMQPGHAFAADTVWQREFEDLFPYVETDNQLRCIDEIKADMEMPYPMDRLLCGDVGFGKTEVAARAVFKCIMDGKQAAILVPTTILANQHYHTFKERFEKFPCTVEMMSRFKSEAAQKAVAEQVADGRVDVLIGTHRILSKDVKFKDLGLLVIDEEQRFGVQHKEAIKYIKKNVDVLTLSATPIPRTLHMSLSGIRSMSTLDEPIEDRYPVQTYVMEQDDELMREILRRELDRGGQAFVVFNRVKGINQVADRLRSLVPEARIAVGHGQMSENRLEDIMMAFNEHEIDILVATTIIESGIDVPNANTLIILDADHFGLAQLYQLRGRVGRSSRVAYAYFMYKKDKILSEVAEKRLRAIREFTEFGSSFKIAMKDLEIRGAGNLLGTEQSGHMMMIGYELYCKLIDNAVRKLRGEAVLEEELEVTLDIKVNAYISSGYIEDEKLKLDMYKRIADIRSDSDISDVTDELIDRFGEVPAETTALMEVALIKAKCRDAGIRRVAPDGSKILFEFVPEHNGLNPAALLKLSEIYGMKLIINMSKRPFIKMPVERTREMLSEIIDFLSVFG